MEKIIKSFILILIFTLSACNAKKGIDIKGSWESQSIEKNGSGTFGKRQFTFEDKNWEVKYTLYLDSLAGAPVFTFRAKGTYNVENPSAKLSGVSDATFSFSNKYVTLHTADTLLVKNFGFVTCDLTPETEKEITEQGCSFLESKSACTQEFDLVSVKDGKLYLGTRPSDGKNMCQIENRPVSLGLPLVKTN